MDEAAYDKVAINGRVTARVMRVADNEARVAICNTNTVGHCHICGRACVWHAPDGRIAHPRCIQSSGALTHWAR
jgi:hypothetical protein